MLKLWKIIVENKLQSIIAYSVLEYSGIENTKNNKVKKHFDTKLAVKKSGHTMGSKCV